jgi:hypothetical protein
MRVEVDSDINISAKTSVNLFAKSASGRKIWRSRRRANVVKSAPDRFDHLSGGLHCSKRKAPSANGLNSRNRLGDNRVTLHVQEGAYNLKCKPNEKCVCGHSMAGGRPPSFVSFTCPNCQALYHVVKAERGPETVDHDLTSRSCGAPLPGREGNFDLKYFLLRKAGRTGRRA